MSADLFAAFTDTPQDLASTIPPTSSGWTTSAPASSAHIPSPSHVTAPDIAEDDDFGDFNDAGDQDWAVDPIPSSRPSDHSAPEDKEIATRAEQHSHPAANSDVFFDAETADAWEDTDFGDFEISQAEPVSQREASESRRDVATNTALPEYASPLTGVSHPPTAKAQRRVAPATDFDLLSLEDTPPRPPSKATGHARNNSSLASNKQAMPRSSARVTQPVAAAAMSPPPSSPAEAWDDFPTPTPTSPTPSTSSRLTLPTTLQCMLLPPPSPPPLPPSNIPPPSLLLALFPPLFTQVSTTVLSPILSLPAPARAEHYSSPPLRALLSSHTRLLSAPLALVLAGRKLRWKRDRRLAQSMAVGAAGGKGMKLVGLDRGESDREEQAALDVLAAYAAHVGPLRAVVGPVNNAAQQQQQIVVPDLGAATALRVRVATAAEGAVTSSVGCALCGLKREERVGAKNALKVEDSFGEWWVEGGTNMHVDCWRFWEGFKGQLVRR